MSMSGEGEPARAVRLALRFRKGKMKHLTNLCILAWCGIVSVRLRPLGHELACLCELVDEVERRCEVLGVWTQGACALTALCFFSCVWGVGARC